MEQTPEIGSIWVSKTDINHTIKVLFADNMSVYFQFDEIKEKDNNKTRTELPTHTFLYVHKPKPRTVTHRVWVNLYKNGTAGIPCATELEVLERAEAAPDFFVETRCIEWEVEE